MRRAITALAVGLLTACGGGDSTQPNTPVAATITIQPASVTLDAIGATSQLSAAVLDQHGQPIGNVTPTWSSSNSAVVSVSTSGLVTALANGTAIISATAGAAHAQVTITVAQAPNAVVKVSGDQQTGQTGHPIAAPLVVQVNDRLNHPIAGVSVMFAAATGGGGVSPTITTTTSAGQAQTTWTLGAATGAQTATATVTGLTNGTVTFNAMASTSAPPTIASIVPDTLIEGQTATITGTNFSTAPAANVVTIDGTAAQVTSASATSLTVTVPASSCKPARLAAVSVSVGGQVATDPQVPINPASFTTLAVGQEAIIQDPTKFCLQLRASSGGEAYVIGLSAPAETPAAVLPFLISATAGVAPSPLVRVPNGFPSLARSPFRLRRAARLGGVSPALRNAIARQRTRVIAEARLRRWEATHLAPLAARGLGASPLITHGGRFGVSMMPALGDTLTLHVPDLSAPDLCTTYTTIRAVVRVIGSAGIWVEDVTNPTADSLTLSDIQNASNQFDAKIDATDTTYFGHPSDIDGNGRILIVLTWQVNKQPNILGFVFSGDLFPPGNCAESNDGEMYYGEVPDTNNVAGTGARPKGQVLAEMPRLIAHEFTHIIQNSQRLFNGGQSMTSWEMEGQATFAEELVGDAVIGNTSGQNYGASVAFGLPGYNWYADEIVKWAEYYGDLGANAQAASAPDLCTVYGNLQLTSLPCDVSAFYGASWIFQRYIGDQYGPVYPGGLIQLTRDWISKNVGLTGTANVAALLNVNYDSLFVRFATALALDDLNNGTGTGWIPNQFSITSWNSGDLASYLSSCCSWGWLNPPVMGFSTASASRSVRGGSTAYTVLSASAAHPSVAYHFTDSYGNPLGTSLRPALWIVRVQ